ncbi:hypothetical protein ILUMI_18362 [Ignelater luminosus]|uniref:LITAF domain-containing protein n=1 Tax=Ignelater luminosus TaxID=2038154 RepID=A0A8K0CLG7_IGNLU|nr:hypothetical protein ILUMI_18362 [Ignelater luminosus]
MDKCSSPAYGPPGVTCVPAPPPPTIYGPVPAMATCPSCNCRITSRVEAEASAKTHILAVLLCGLCCCCIPYCMDSCKNKNHYCPNCGAFLGTFKN